jgi:hypothetical protein
VILLNAMDDENAHNNDGKNVSEAYEHNLEHFRNVSENELKDYEAVPNHSERSDIVSETFPNLSERSAEHTLSVRDTAKIFESAAFPLTERTVINWCHPNRHGVERLDCFFDEHDGKYFITPHSVDEALKEEAKKSAHDSSIYDDFSARFGKTQETFPKGSEILPKSNGNVSEAFGSVRKEAEPLEYHEPIQRQHVEKQGYEKEADRGGDRRLKDLEQEVLELKILNKGKDYFIDQLKQDREYVVQERAQLVSQLTASVKEIGVLETKLLQLEAPRERVIDGGRSNA